jgi:GntR family transcriptional regulator/MocR family aminotransferase
VLPEDLVAPFVAARHLTDRQSSGLAQAIMNEFILGGHFARHLKRMRTHYGARQAFLLDLLRREAGGLLDVRRVEPGMYLTAWLPSDCDDRAAAAALAEAGVAAVPLAALTLATPRPPALVLGYAGHGEAAMIRTVERLAAVLQRQSGLLQMAKVAL